MNDSTISENEALRQAYRALDAIERLVGDDWCSDLEWKSINNELTGDEKIMEEKIGLIYQIAHSESPNHSCHHVHSEWRKTKEIILSPTPTLGTRLPVFQNDFAPVNHR